MNRLRRRQAEEGSVDDESVEELRSQVSARIAQIKRLNEQAKAIIAGFATKENTINGTG